MKTNETTTTEIGETAVKDETSSVLLDRACDISGFCSTDSSRYVLGAVHFRGQDCEATDGRVLIRVPYMTPDADNTLDALVPASVVKDGMKMAGKAGQAMLEVNGKALLSAGGKALTSELTDDQYPTVDQVIPTGMAHYTICFAGELLKTIADYAVKNGSLTGKSVGVTFEFGSDDCSPARFSIALAEGRVARGVVMPMRRA